MSISEKNALKRESIITELKRLCPHVELEETKHVTNLVYYTASVQGGRVVTSKNTRGIYVSSIPEKLVKYEYRTKKEAQDAISKVYPKALAKFNRCLEAFNKFKADLNIDISYSYDGDSYGIYDEYECMSFNMDGFYFEFRLDP